ncbi:MAG: glutaredoxin [Lachnospiraceae bacterium]|nr:glutaredoxin [Lachnospiraceae bacterium]
MIKIYGTELCKDCVALKANLDANKVEYDFRDIGKTLKDLAVFIKIRDLNKIFDPIKGTGTIGIPAIVTEDNEVIIDWKKFLEEKGYEIVQQGAACGIDGKGC